MLSIKTAIVGAALAMVSSAAPILANAQHAPDKRLIEQAVVFDLSVQISIPVFSAKRSADHPPGRIVADRYQPDDFNPWFGALKVDLHGGRSDIEARLLSDPVLYNGTSRIPMIVVTMGHPMKTYEPLFVAHADELGQHVKTIAFTAKGIAHKRPPPGNYYGDLTILLEPRLPEAP
ncbi:MAG: hypothetical protein JHC61_02470 [Burkholderiaceae bacterium]|nr:hypothetical protein [Burkholderiaceae bacterium]